MSGYKVQRCPSHEVHSSPRTWETVYETADAADAIRELWNRRKVGRASGNLYRIVDAGGVVQEVLSATECGPAY